MICAHVIKCKEKYLMKKKIAKSKMCCIFNHGFFATNFLCKVVIKLIIVSHDVVSQFTPLCKGEMHYVLLMVTVDFNTKI